MTYFSRLSLTAVSVWSVIVSLHSTVTTPTSCRSHSWVRSHL